MNAVGIFILIALVIFAVYFVMKQKGLKVNFKSNRNIILDPQEYAGEKDISNEMINFYHAVLTKYLDFYRRLNKNDRKKFINRLHDLIEHMDFIGEQGQAVNLQVSIMCCAPLIQITFGLETYLFNSFHTIIVFPKQFFSQKHGRYVKGGVSRGDAIYFSYEDLVKGFNIPNDALNLGLHEMAHAIHIEYFDEEFELKFPQWEKIAEQELLDMRYQSNPILRNYAGQNKHELFAVCVETFFEQSLEMKEKQPKLYNAMCHLLNQRPHEMYTN